MADIILKADHLKKVFISGKKSMTAVDDVSFELERGECLGIVGESGSGKSTIAKMITHLEPVTDGQIFLKGKDITHVGGKSLRKTYQDIQMVFQMPMESFDPRCTLGDGIGESLRNMGINRTETRTRVENLLERCGLSKEYADRYPHQVSGGQCQRAAIARALANNPHVLLLDEPLGALDLKLRKDMQTELKSIQKRLGITFVYVTHDQEEALSMSDTVVVMDKGKIQQIGTPEDIYNEPVNAFVADFIGESNIVDAIMLKDYVVSFGGVTFDCLDAGFGENAFVEAVVRPEDIRIVEPGAKASLTGEITSVTFKGVHFEILVDVGGFIWMIQTTEENHKVGEKIGMYIEPDAIHIMNRSEYSGEFGDYSSFSDEMDHISDASYNWEDSEDE